MPRSVPSPLDLVWIDIPTKRRLRRLVVQTDVLGSEDHLLPNGLFHLLILLMGYIGVTYYYPLIQTFYQHFPQHHPSSEVLMLKLRHQGFGEGWGEKYKLASCYIRNIIM